MKYKGYMIVVHFEKYGYSYSVDGIKSDVRIYTDYINAIDNAKHDIDKGYWE